MGHDPQFTALIDAWRTARAADKHCSLERFFAERGRCWACFGQGRQSMGRFALLAGSADAAQAVVTGYRWCPACNGTGRIQETVWTSMHD